MFFDDFNEMLSESNRKIIASDFVSDAEMYIADIEISYLLNNKFLVQVNNNYKRNSLVVETTNATITNKEVDKFKEGKTTTTHTDFVIALGESDGLVVFKDKTFNGYHPEISWIYRNGKWAVCDFMGDIRIIEMQKKGTKRT
jgi:hypothetical protein